MTPPHVPSVESLVQDLAWHMEEIQRLTGLADAAWVPFSTTRHDDPTKAQKEKAYSDAMFERRKAEARYVSAAEKAVPALLQEREEQRAENAFLKRVAEQFCRMGKMMPRREEAPDAWAFHDDWDLRSRIQGEATTDPCEVDWEADRG